MPLMRPGGMPLALELAAGWLRVLPLEAIADELEAGLELLAAEDAPVDPRHRTMRAVFDASWAALSARERAALERLAAFHGGFTEVAALERIFEEDLERTEQVGLTQWRTRSLMTRIKEGVGRLFSPML